MVPFVALAWVVAAVVAAAAEDYDRAPSWLLLVNQILLAPALIGAAWWHGQNLAGRLGGIVAPLAVTLVPVLGVLYADERIRGAYVDRVLTNAVGISEGGGFAVGALLLVGTALVVAGLAERRYRACSAAGVALALAVLAVAATRHGIGLDVSRSAFDANMAGLREFTWSNRVLQWLPLAGAIGAARRSPLTGLLLGVWFGAFALAYGASPNFDIGDVTFFNAFVPALPAFSLLVACVPLLVPTVPARLERRESAKLNALRPVSASGAQPNRSTPPNAGQSDR